MIRRSLLSCFAGLLLAGCSLSFPQYEAAKALFDRPDATDVDFGEFLWELRWAGRRVPVYAVATESGIAFAGEETPVITFDGLYLTQARRLLPQGRSASVSVDESGDGLTFYEAGAEVLEATCGPWASDFTASGVRWQRTCTGLDEPIIREEDETGSILRLSQPVHPSFPSVELVRARGAER